jgi:hypothetical protein
MSLTIFKGGGNIFDYFLKEKEKEGRFFAGKKVWQFAMRAGRKKEKKGGGEGGLYNGHCC